MKNIACQIVLLFIFLFHCACAKGQVTNITKFRNWTTPSGSTIKAKAISLSSESVRLLFADTGKEHDAQLAKLTQVDLAYIAELKTNLSKKVNNRVADCVLAKDALVIYQEYQNSGFVPAEVTHDVSARVNELQQFADNDCVQLTDEFIPREQLVERKKETDQIISDWLSNAKIGLETKTKELKRVTKFDPTSIDAAILESFCFEVYNHDHKQGGKILERAIARAEKFSTIANAYDKINLIAAQNNLGVSYARLNQVSKALKIWKEIDESEAPAALKHNVARTLEMINREAGIANKKSKELRELKELHSRIRATGGQGGWHLICPVDNEGIQRVELQFLNTDFARVNAGSGLIIDARCVTCAGTCIVSCGNCNGHGGRNVKETYMKLFTYPNGKKQKIPAVKNVWQPCNICNESGRVDCGNCTQGSQ